MSATYQSIEQRYGEVVALSILMDTERHVGLNSYDLAGMRPDERFERAMRLMGAGEAAVA